MNEHEALKDIKDTVHRIDSEVRSYRDEQLRQRADIAKVEARQEAMHQVHVRLEEKIDTIGKTLGKEISDVKDSLGKGINGVLTTLQQHTAKEDADRSKFLVIGWALALSILAYLAVLVFENFLGGRV